MYIKHDGKILSDQDVIIFRQFYVQLLVIKSRHLNLFLLTIFICLDYRLAIRLKSGEINVSKHDVGDLRLYILD
jgi:hypothetical protein